MPTQDETKKTTPQSIPLKGVKTTRKSALSTLVRKKPKTTTESNTASTVSTTATASRDAKAATAATDRQCAENAKPEAATSEKTTESQFNRDGSCDEKKVAVPSAATVTSALGLLGNYSGSDTDSSG